MPSNATAKTLRPMVEVFALSVFRRYVRMMMAPDEGYAIVIPA
jgi:hypothetical protein